MKNFRKKIRAMSFQSSFVEKVSVIEKVCVKREANILCLVTSLYQFWVKT